MILTIDAGNTETVAGLFEGDELVENWRIATRIRRSGDELGLLFIGLIAAASWDVDDVDAVVIASVVPPLTPALRDACVRHLDAEAFVVDATTDLPIRLDVEEPLTVGADRIVNTLAAANLYGRDTVAVDLGTATTFDCISAAGEFLGGVIAPGVRTGADTLTRRTAKLPRVDLDRPATVIGRRTETMLQNGIFYGAVDTIDGIVRRIQSEWDTDPLVVAAGGLAALLGPQCATVEKIEPFLTLHGLQIAHRHLTDKTTR